MAKSKKTKQAEKKARVAEKQERKASKKEKKNKGKGRGEDSDADDDVDLDAILADYAAKQEQFMKITETVQDEPPTARSSATLLGSPANPNELFLFGGETYDGTYAKFFNDLFVYNIKHDRWSSVTSGNAPLPRSGHAWCRGGNAGGIYLFGGEFSSPKQGTFYHYKDFWHLDPASREWTRLEGKGKLSPPARSGHRMTYFKNYIVLFGGFQDTSAQTKYLQDLWLYDCQQYTWHQPALPPAAGKPDARSSFTFLPHESGAVLFGGYSREKVAVPTKSTKKSGSSSASRVATKPVVHQDTWFLRITPPPADAPSGTSPTVRWERRKRPVNQPNPPRLGATMAFHKGRGVLFGGVHDTTETDEAISSEFFNELYVWNIDRNRFMPLAIRRPRTGKKAGNNGGDGGGAQALSRRDRAKANDEELLRNLAALEMKAANTAGVGTSIHDLELDLGLDLGQSDDEDDKPEPKPVQYELPHARFNASLAVQGDVLYIFGGTIEVGDREFTFSELWAVDLGKLDGVKQLFAREMPEGWDKEAESSDEEDDDDEDEDEDEDGDGDEEEEEEEEEEAEDEAEDEAESEVSAKKKKKSKSKEKEKETGKEDKHSDHDKALKRKGKNEKRASEADADAEAEESPDSTNPNDVLPQPRPFESLREFYARTALQWQNVVLAEHGSGTAEARTDTSAGTGHSAISTGDTTAAATQSRSGAGEAAATAALGSYLQSKSIKELRKDAFAKAEERFWDCREEVRALEDEQLDAGIGEIVNVGAGGAGAGGESTGTASGARRR